MPASHQLVTICNCYKKINWHDRLECIDTDQAYDLSRSIRYRMHTILKQKREKISLLAL